MGKALSNPLEGDYRVIEMAYNYFVPKSKSEICEKMTAKVSKGIGNLLSLSLREAEYKRDRQKKKLNE